MSKIMKNLFSSPSNIVLSLLWLLLLITVIPPFIQWAVLDAVFIADHGSQCSREAACWAFIYARFDDFIFGRYPDAERWRVIIGLLLPVTLFLIYTFIAAKHKTKFVISAVVLCPIISLIFFRGGVFSLEVVDTRLWGGLFLTIVIAASSITFALPIGIILALARRSSYPVISILSTLFIEVSRSVPMITVLFVASIMFPFFVPEGVEIDKLLRTVIAVTLFAGAYMAEVVRGGLQAIPKGQYEAASAMGLGYWQTMGLIILPQALKISIPPIVNLFIGFFKDTTLVLVIGLFDLLNMVTTTTSDPDWFGYAIEGYIFVGLVFFIFCFSMGSYSKKLEKKLNNKSHANN
ncbi:amino acid ABC transporter permease [Vibrio sp. TH_r3]|uniref:amino acid ABC transporter permease n=1 Tax=Vibrio sp. TH_r3 TaxID=3082084 RepID=UPI002955D89C|nr:amino acid ABC transporter permease [Vibrio sp. TH_r3]MDV7105784.1 amino acid ABC transporter permease [Vibrio sp. TH_r3]